MQFAFYTCFGLGELQFKVDKARRYGIHLVEIERYRMDLIFFGWTIVKYYFICVFSQNSDENVQFDSIFDSCNNGPFQFLSGIP